MKLQKLYEILVPGDEEPVATKAIVTSAAKRAIRNWNVGQDQKAGEMVRCL